MVPFRFKGFEERISHSREIIPWGAAPLGTYR